MLRRVIPAVLLVLTGCSAIAPSQVGQTAGTIAGAAIAPGVGAPLGALVGTLAGMVVESQMDKNRERREHVELSKQLEGAAAAPSAASASETGTPTRVWVDDTIEQGRLIAGHFETRSIP